MDRDGARVRTKLRGAGARSETSCLKALWAALVWGIRIPFCRILPAAIVPTEWYLLDFGNAAHTDFLGLRGPWSMVTVHH